MLVCACVLAIIAQDTGSTPQPSSSLVGRRLGSFGTALPLVDGAGHLVAPWADGHPAVLLFFAHWCAPCRAELPTLARAIGAGVIDGAQVVGVDEDASIGTASAFVRQSHVHFPVGEDTLTQLAELLVPSGLPAAVFVDGDGRITAVHYGALTPTSLRADTRRFDGAR